MKAIVTGGAGFIGSHLVDRLVSNGWDVVIIDNFSSGRREFISHHIGNPHVRIAEIDLKDREEVEGFKEFRDADIVFHYAANPEVRVSSTNPRIHFNENILATFNLLEALRKYDVDKLVFASSSSVYGDPPEIPVDENAPIRPVSVYGASKAACEAIMHSYSILYGIKTVILRYTNVVGPRLRHGVIHDLLLKLEKNPYELEVLGDGTQTRSYIYITDTIDATLLAAEKTKNNYEIYNVGSKDWITVKDIVKAILEELGLRNVKIKYKPILHGVGWPGDVKRIALDISKIEKLGFKPKYNSIEAVRLTTRSLIKELNITVGG